MTKQSADGKRRKTKATATEPGPASGPSAAASSAGPAATGPAPAPVAAQASASDIPVSSTPLVDPSYVRHLEKTLEQAEQENKMLEFELAQLRVPDPNNERSYFSYAERTMRGYVALCMRSRYALEQEEVSGKRAIFEQRMTQITEIAERLVREALEDMGYSMKSVDKEQMFADHCASKQKDKAEPKDKE